MDVFYSLEEDEQTQEESEVEEPNELEIVETNDGNVFTSSNHWRVVSALGNLQICQLALASVETSAQGGCWKAL